MGLLDFVRNRNANTARAENMIVGRTDRGHQITSLSSGEWQLDPGGRCKTRMHIGASKEGYHAGLQVAWNDGGGTFHWTNARATVRDAGKASKELYSAWYRGERMREQKHVRRQSPSWER